MREGWGRSNRKCFTHTHTHTHTHTQRPATLIVDIFVLIGATAAIMNTTAHSWMELGWTDMRTAW